MNGPEKQASMRANPAVLRAMRAVEAAVPEAESDAGRPGYHFHPPARTMSDPDGPIHYREWYHLFYQFNPYANEFPSLQNGEWDYLWYWGHARSRDLVHWEHLPIALWPSVEKDETHCASGCTVIAREDRPMILYTYMGPSDSCVDAAQQWAAMGDDALIVWEKYSANPIVPESLHGDVKIYQWRDPYVFKESGRTYLVLGGKLGAERGGDPVVALYEAEDEALTRWKYRGILYRHPDKKRSSVELPSFFRLGEKWALISNPYAVEWNTGEFDQEQGAFLSEATGLVDAIGDRFYSGTVFLDQNGRPLLLGCISRGHLKGLEWHGCMSLPRVLSLGEHGELLQDPIPELESLRGRHAAASDIPLGAHGIKDVTGDMLEIRAQIDPGTARSCGVKLVKQPGGQTVVDIRCDGDDIRVNDAHTPFRLREDEETLDLRIFFDRRVCEVFANRRACVTQVIGSACEAGAAAFAEGGDAMLKRLDVWSMAPATFVDAAHEPPKP